MAALFIE